MNLKVCQKIQRLQGSLLEKGYTEKCFQIGLYCNQILLEVSRKKDLIHEALGFQSCKMQEIQRLEALEQEFSEKPVRPDDVYLVRFLSGVL